MKKTKPKVRRKTAIERWRVLPGKERASVAMALAVAIARDRGHADHNEHLALNVAWRGASWQIKASAARLRAHNLNLAAQVLREVAGKGKR